MAKRTEPITPKPFSPLDKSSLGRSVMERLLEQPVYTLGQIPRFLGAGIYALYYTGFFPPYAKLSLQNRKNLYRRPIYVGKAEPKRTTTSSETSDKEQLADFYLYKRLTKHATSISEAENLELDDFFCRYLVVDDVWIRIGETLLIQETSPPWNDLVLGFGINVPGGGRTGQRRSLWDTLHPGRELAKSLREGAKSFDDLATEVEMFIEQTDRR